MGSTMAFSKMTKKKETANLDGQTMSSIRESGNKANAMGLECGHLQKEITIWANGRKV